MRLILQRVERAAVRVAAGEGEPPTAGGQVVGQIGPGMLVLAGVETDDTEAEAAAAADKLAGLRIFEDKAGKMNLAAADAFGDTGAAFLVVSQFTLAADLSKGRRPSFNTAARPEVAEPLVDALVADLRRRGFTVETGRFGAEMKVELVNDGPVTFVVDV